MTYDAKVKLASGIITSLLNAAINFALSYLVYRLAFTHRWPLAIGVFTFLFLMQTDRICSKLSDK